MKKENGFKHPRGFSIVELLVSITIMVTISGLFLTNYKAGQDKALLNSATQNLVSDLRMLQGYALGAKKNSENEVKGWGIHFQDNNPSNTLYTIFNDKVNDLQFNNGDLTIGEIDFPDGIKINNGDIKINDINRNPMNVVFMAPNPDTHIYVNPADPNSADNTGTIKLTNTKTGEYKIITINPFGLIDVK